MLYLVKYTYMVSEGRIIEVSLLLPLAKVLLQILPPKGGDLFAKAQRVEALFALAVLNVKMPASII